MDLNTLSQLAQVLSGAAVVIAIVFGVAQVRQFRQQRLDSADLELMRFVQDREFVRAVPLVLYPNPGTLQLSELGAHGPEFEGAAFALSARFEGLGLLVVRGSIPFDLVEQLIGGVCVLLWQKLEPWIEQLRKEHNHELLFEWFQWLAERLIERSRLDHVPAYVRCRDWKPSR